MSIDIPEEIVAAFKDSAEEHILKMENSCLELEANNFDEYHYNALVHSTHSLKGMAGSFGFGNITKICHSIEEKIKELTIEDRTKIITEILSFIDKTKEILDLR